MWGVTLVTQVLRGSRAGRVRELGLEDLSTYGLLKGTPAGRLRRWVEALEGAEVRLSGAPSTRPSGHPPGQGRPLPGGAGDLPPETGGGGPPAGQGRPGSAGRPLGGGGAAGCPETGPGPGGPGRRKTPLYLIFSNATLADMARRRPRTWRSCWRSPGVGQVKAQKYGETFLRALAGYEEEQP